MTYDIHVDILLGWVLDCATIACALRWGVALVGDYHYWVFLTPLWDPLSGTGPVQAAEPHTEPHMG